MPSVSTYHLTGVSLTLAVEYLFNGCSSKVQLLLLILDLWGHLLAAHHPSTAQLPLTQHILLLLLSHVSLVRLCVTPLMVAQQAPPSVGFSRQEYWSGLPLPSLQTYTR